MTTVPCALLAAVGFFALPAMQVLLLQDFKDMSGLAGGVSKLVMTLTSTGMSMLVSSYFSDWGQDRKGHYTHYHTQRLLYSLAAILVVLQIWFWLVYLPLRRCRAPERQPDPSLRLDEERHELGVEPLTATPSSRRSSSSRSEGVAVAPLPAWTSSAIAAAPVRVQ